MMRVGIAHNSAAVAATLHDMIATLPGFSVAWVAKSGVNTLESCKVNTPDLLLLDLRFTDMDSVKIAAAIMKNTPCTILVMTSSMKMDQGLAFDALSAGAMDVVKMPAMEKDVPSHLIDIEKFKKKLSDLARIIRSNRKPNRHKTSKTKLLIGIGASTGGPKAVVSVLSAIPKPIQATMIVVVHVNQEFAEGMAQWMSGMTGHTVRTAQEGDIPKAGEILLAASNDHLVLNPNGTLGYTATPIENPFRPSVDVMFKSLVQHWRGKAIGVLLTGMGEDGALGLQALRQHGWFTIAQDEKSSVIYGMPKAAAKIDAATEILSLNNIGIKLASLIDDDKEK